VMVLEECDKNRQNDLMSKQLQGISRYVLIFNAIVNVQVIIANFNNNNPSSIYTVINELQECGRRSALKMALIDTKEELRRWENTVDFTYRQFEV
jgi:hypothetical protein